MKSYSNESKYCLNFAQDWTRGIGQTGGGHQGGGQQGV